MSKNWILERNGGETLRKQKDLESFDDEDEIIIRVEHNNMSDQIWVLIPPRLWDVDNLGDYIKKAITMTVADIPDGLDS